MELCTSDSCDTSELAFFTFRHNDDQRIQFVCLGLHQLHAAVRSLRLSLLNEMSLQASFSSLGAHAIMSHITELINTVVDKDGHVRIGYESSSACPPVWTSLVSLLARLRRNWDALVECCHKNTPVTAEILDTLSDTCLEIRKAAPLLELRNKLIVAPSARDANVPQWMLRNGEVVAGLMFALVAAMVVLSWTLHAGVVLPIISTCIALVLSGLMLMILPSSLTQRGSAQDDTMIRGPATTASDRGVPPHSGVVGVTARAVTIGVDSKRNIIEWNSAARDVFGWDLGELKGRPFATIFEPDTNLDGLLLPVESNRSYTGRHLKVMSKDSSFKNLLATVVPHPNDRAGWLISGVVDLNDKGNAVRYFSNLAQFLIQTFDTESVGTFMQLIPDLVEGGVSKWTRGSVPEFLRSKFPEMIRHPELSGDLAEVYHDRANLSVVAEVLHRSQEYIQSITVEECDAESGEVFSLHFQVRITFKTSELHKEKGELRAALQDVKSCVFNSLVDETDLVIVVPAQRAPFSQSLIVGASRVKQKPTQASTNDGLSSPTCIIVEERNAVAVNLKLGLERMWSTIAVKLQKPTEFDDYLSKEEPQRVHCVAASTAFWNSLSTEQLAKLAGVVKVSTTDQVFPPPSDRRLQLISLPVPIRTSDQLSAVIKAIKRSITRETNDLYIYDRFKQGKRLGHGGAAKVVLGESDLSGARVAIKSFTHKGLHTMTIEESTYRRLERNPKDVSDRAPGARYILHPISIKEESLVLELCQATLSKVELDPTSLLVCVQEILEGIAFLHAQGIAHRDIKPENVMLKVTATGRITIPPSNEMTTPQCAEVRIIDLGSAAFSSEKFPIKSDGQTPLYAEQAQAQTFDDCCRGDVWAVGLTAMELLKVLPLSKVDLNPQNLMNKAKDNAIPEVWRRLLPDMICDRHQRKSARELADRFKVEISQVNPSS